MCHPIIIGAAIGAATGAIGSAVTGGDPLQGALMGGLMGGIGGHFGMFETGGMAETLGGKIMGDAGKHAIFGATSQVTGQAAAGAATIGLGGSISMGMLTQRQQNFANTGMPYTPQPYNTQHTQVTGSGGRQAAAVLASEIKQAKKLRQRQAGVEDYGLGMATTGTGLQIA